MKTFLLLAALLITTPEAPEENDYLPMCQDEIGYIVITQSKEGLHVYLANSLSQASKDIPEVVCYLDQDHLIKVLGKGKEI